MRAQNLVRHYMRVKKKLFFTVGIMALVSLVVAIYAAMRISEANTILLQSAIGSRNLVEATEKARTAQVHFKIQVQEWKDVLLRGAEPELYEKHYQAFLQEESNVRSHMKELKAIWTGMELPVDRIDEFLSAHEALSTQYRDAILKYDKSAPESAFAVDGLVRGIDREPTQMIDAIVSFMRAHSLAGLENQEELSAARAEGDSYSVQGIMLLVACGVVLGSFLVVTAIKEIRATSRSQL